MQQQIEEDVKNILIPRVKAQLKIANNNCLVTKNTTLTLLANLLLAVRMVIQANRTKNYCGYLWW